MKKSYFLLGLVMIIQFFLLIACNSAKKDSKTVTITDMVGDVVEVPKNPEKVAVLARSAVDMLVAFGLGEKVTGIYYTIFDNDWKLACNLCPIETVGGTRSVGTGV